MNNIEHSKAILELKIKEKMLNRAIAAEHAQQLICCDYDDDDLIDNTTIIVHLQHDIISILKRLAGIEATE